MASPHFAAGSRGILDVLATDYHGRLVVIEVKASEDIHLPLQALDYWMRVKWHLEAGNLKAADTSRVSRCAPTLRAWYWSHLRSISIRPMRPYCGTFLPRFM